MDNRVSAVSVSEYELEPLITATEQHFARLGVWECLRPGMRVVLKPNLLARYTPERAVTTHPMVVEAVAAVLHHHDIDDIVLADSPGGPYSKALLQSFYQVSGMQAAAERCGITLNFSTGWQSRSCPASALCREFDIIDPIADSDFIINLCKLKTHAMVMYSGAVKNLFGCIPGLQKPELHFRFPEPEQFCRMLVDLAELLRPGVTLMDAVVAMEGDGPAGGDARPVGLTLAACNPHALDLAACDLIGLQAEMVQTVAIAMKDGLCPATAQEIDWLGGGAPPPLENFRPPASKPLSFGGHVPRFVQRPLEWLERHWLSPRPVISRRDCIGCGKCAESCAPGAVAIVDGKAVIDRTRCIRCYCCQEMCPVKAVKIRRTGILHL